MDSVLDEVRSVIGDVLDRGDGSWRALQESGLLALAAPEKLGGEGLGLTEISVLLHEVGRRAANLPGVGDGRLRPAAPRTFWLRRPAGRSRPQVLAGELMFAPALGEPGAALPINPATTYDGTTVTGTKVGVPVLEGSTLLLVSSAFDGSDGAASSPWSTPTAPGVSKVDTRTSRGTTEATYTFTAAPAVGTLDADVVRNHAIAGLAALGAGVVEGARDLTAGYIRDRKQFGRSLAEFQAVAQQIADVYIGSRTFTLTATEVVRRLDAGDPAADDLAIAAYWFANRAPGADADLPAPPRRHGRRRDVRHAALLRRRARHRPPPRWTGRARRRAGRRDRRQERRADRRGARVQGRGPRPT